MNKDNTTVRNAVPPERMAELISGKNVSLQLRILLKLLNDSSSGTLAPTAAFGSNEASTSHNKGVMKKAATRARTA